MKRKKLFINESWITITGIVILFLAFFYHFDKANLLYHLGDEFGYWADAAYIYGYDWSGVASHNTYYSFGYSIVLAPLFTITNFEVRYKAALFMNILMQIISFLLLNNIAKKIFVDINKNMITLISFCVTLYTSNTFFAKTTLAESFLYLSYVIITYLVVQVCKKYTWKYFILLGLMSAFIYVIHMRAIAITISVICFLMMEFFLRKENRKKIIFTFVVMAILFIFIAIFKQYLVNNLYGANDTVSVNDFSGQVSKVKLIFSLEGIALLIKSAIGKIYYLFSATYMVIGWTVIWIMLQVKALDNCLKNKKKPLEINKFAIYILLSFLGTLGISSIYMMEESSVIDHLIYGRYNEHILGPLLIIGGCYLISLHKLSWYNQVRIILMYLLCAFMVISTFKSVSNPSIREVNIAGIAYLAYDGNSCLYNNWEMGITLKVILFSLLIFFLLKQTKQQWKVIAFLILAATWLRSGNFVLDYQLHYRDSYYSCKNISNYIYKNQITEVTYLMNDTYVYFDSLRPDILQYMNPELNITYKNIDDIFYQNEKIFFVRKGKFKEEEFDEYAIVATSDDFNLYIKK